LNLDIKIDPTVIWIVFAFETNIFLESDEYKIYKIRNKIDAQLKVIEFIALETAILTNKSIDDTLATRVKIYNNQKIYKIYQIGNLSKEVNSKVSNFFLN